MQKHKKSGPSICFLDIEATSLEADVGTMVGAGIMEDDGKFSYISVNRPELEKDKLDELLEKLEQYHIVVTWNGKSFDIPFLISRTVKHNLKVEPLLSIYHLDMAELVRNNLKLSRTDLFHVSKFLGIKKDVTTLGQDVPALYVKAIKGDRAAVRLIKSHCKDDLNVLRLIFLKLKPLVKALKPELPI
ncbi:MAG: ribonuclease H-like domain-containing protein [Thaumarchaeota archaeon]|nr:ribonuclease H-like domain-containing protein [Candidatus Terraquivivens yellowstonensis]MCL7392920.1 ribonuclease H-like domain-containing protein [Candidatus Terraquivivens yellowstonensis]MCL7397665.1 ribonuclease H-like domain-containing protein [Candidatus Terraquivivens yellowstonensis]MCL7399041.1 ribonuclease H-like domain-containing protein [Candidatus Terraquivivens yellowstonensis]MCL7400601.1 ribonuclease H-like domain-containing protein [Candidatus Terraquivivens yellowstonensis